MKKLIAILLAFSMLFAFAACKDNTSDETVTTTSSTVEIVETTSQPEETSAVVPSENTDVTEESTTAAETTTVPVSDDPSEWTNEEIIEFYKAAATKTHPHVQHHQTMTLDELVVGEEGGMLSFFLNIAKPAINSVLEKNSATFDGITGGYQNLAVSDAKTIKAYKSGGYTVIEMTLKEQNDGKHGHNMSGTVGHAITVLGDVSVAVAEFPQFKIDTDNADIKIKYHDAFVKVKINSNGIIEKGTWEYIAGVDIKNLGLNFKDAKTNDLIVKKATAEIGYNIVVNGGF